MDDSVSKRLQCSEADVSLVPEAGDQGVYQSADLYHGAGTLQYVSQQDVSSVLKGSGPCWSEVVARSLLLQLPEGSSGIIASSYALDKSSSTITRQSWYEIEELAELGMRGDDIIILPLQCLLARLALLSYKAAFQAFPAAMPAWSSAIALSL